MSRILNLSLLIGTLLAATPARAEEDLPLVGFAEPETRAEVVEICNDAKDRMEYMGTLPDGNLSKLVCEDSAPLGQVITRPNRTIAEVIIWDWFTKGIRSDRRYFENGQLEFESRDGQVFEFYENGQIKREGKSGGIVEREWDVNGNLVLDNSRPTVRREKADGKLVRETLMVGCATIKSAYEKGMLLNQQVSVSCNGMNTSHTTFYSNGNITSEEIRNPYEETTTLYDRNGNPALTITSDASHRLLEKVTYTSATDGVRLRIEGNTNHCYRFGAGKEEQLVDCAVFHHAAK